MKVEIWSDIQCPFCYIGKRHFEEALSQVKTETPIDIEWKSFQLDPEMENRPDTDVYTYLAERKGQTREWSVAMHNNVTEMARAAGLDYRFDIAVPANSFKAHRLIQMAKKKGKDNEIEELLFKAYFTEGKNMNDDAILADIGEQAGLEKAAILHMLSSDEFTDEVNQDITEASRLGIRGVPFFVFDRKYAVSGAQPPEVFAGAIQQAIAGE